LFERKHIRIVFRRFLTSERTKDVVGGSSLADAGTGLFGDVGGLEGMDADVTVERGSSEQVWVSSAPGGLEGPVISCWEFTDDFTSLGVPA